MEDEPLVAPSGGAGGGELCSQCSATGIPLLACDDPDARANLPPSAGKPRFVQCCTRTVSCVESVELSCVCGIVVAVVSSINHLTNYVRTDLYNITLDTSIIDSATIACYTKRFACFGPSTNRGTRGLSRNTTPRPASTCSSTKMGTRNGSRLARTIQIVVVQVGLAHRLGQQEEEEET
jgi:hypothetical protein